MSGTAEMRRVPSSSRGVLLGLREVGPVDAPIVVLLHGFPLSGAMWTPQIAALESDWRILAPDARGAGTSDVGRGPCTMETLVDDLFAVLDGVAPDRRVVAVGLSMGGYILLRAHEREPDRFAGVVLCDTRSAADGDAGKLARAVGVRRIEREGLAPFATDFLAAVLAPDTELRHPGLAEDLLRMILESSPVGIAGQLLAMAARTDTTGSLGAIEVPALVVAGSEDRLTPPATCRELAEQIPGAEFAELEGAGHLSSIEAPIAFDRVLRNYLDRL